VIYPGVACAFSFPYRFLYFFCISSIHVYAIMMAGWRSNCKYGLIGAIRGAAQRISYEVVFRLVAYRVILYCRCFKLEFFISLKYFGFLIMPDFLLIWMIVSLAEINRAPFDFVEGESELVSGFRMEYGGGKFALIALGEYGRVLFIGVVTSCLYFNANWFEG